MKVVLALLVIPLILAPAAQGDTGDDAFLETLRASGIHIKNSNATIAASHVACMAFDQGQSYLSVTNVIENSTGLDDWQSGFFVGDAIASYCPEYKGLVP
jgi:hypothetical protein